MIKKSNPTMLDVARLAAVSVATVSAVINGSAVVSPQRAQRVRDAAEALDYHADQVARSLKTGRSNVVGVVIPDVTNPFYPEVISGAEEVASRAGYSLILCNANEDPAQERRLLNTLFSHRVDGVLISCSDSSTAYDSLVRRRFPIVFFDRIPQGFQGVGISTDNAAGGYQATHHLISLGHSRIAIAAGRLHLSTHANRLEGFRLAMQEAALPIRGEYCRVGGLTIESGFEAGLELLRLPEPPTAVFCTNNKMLLGFLRATSELGVPFPARISIAGFDDYAWTEHFHPSLTTVAQPTRAIGRRAMELLLVRIQAVREGRTVTDNQTIVLPPELRIRDSTGAPSAAPIEILLNVSKSA
ncbi:MAG: LacI family transcriptional regulator [Acidobacteriota bacterium]|nr:LacI family transcriptional regulator [Acidobacteriota bacterium]